MNDDELKSIRHHLHQHPELSGKEKSTQHFIITRLKEMGVEDISAAGGCGVVARFKAEEPGPCILLRADMDALPIAEENSFEYRSRAEGISHKCGHDGHTTIMLGVAAHLQQQQLPRGEVTLLFQPAEETGQGAEKVLQDPQFNVKADYAFALHNLPGYPLHQVVCRRGPFTAAVKSLIVKLHGRTSHAAEPEKGINPALAIAEILQRSESLSQKDIERDDFRLITLIHVTMGEKAYGVSAGYGEVHLSLRSWYNEQLQQLEQDLMQHLRSIAGKHQLKLETTELEVFHANQNHKQAFEIVQTTAGKENLEFVEPGRPFKWGEDFGLFTQKYAGAMFGIGAGEDSPALHNPNYDFPDEITRTGIRMFTGIINEILQ